MARSDFGRHLLIDFIDCDPTILSTVSPTRTIMLQAMHACGATIIADRFHQFEPHGVSGLVLIAESHASIHTWPEERFAAVDIFTCGEMDPQIAVDMMKAAFGAREIAVKAVVRGQLTHA